MVVGDPGAGAGLRLCVCSYLALSICIAFAFAVLSIPVCPAVIYLSVQSKPQADICLCTQLVPYRIPGVPRRILYRDSFVFA